MAMMLAEEGNTGWGSPWIEPAACNNSQLLLLTVVYGYVLYQSSNLISNGSELLLLIPAVAGLVGSIVLPILGAVPDSMMTLMSGNSQKEVGVGVGVLAGSSVFLLCIPWFVAVIYGRVPLGKDGSADYSKRSQAPSSFSASGISFEPSINTNAKIMMLTCILYLVIQVPATLQEEKTPPESTAEEAKNENLVAAVGCFLCVLAFCGYLAFCYRDATKTSEDRVLTAVIEGIKNKTISLPATLHFAIETAKSDKFLLNKESEYLTRILKPFFRRYDSEEPKGSVDQKEFQLCCDDLGIHTKGQRDELWRKAAATQAGKPGTLLPDITLLRFTDAIYTWANEKENHESLKNLINKDPSGVISVEDDDDADVEEVPNDLADLKPEDQKKAILFRSAWMMGLGTFVVIMVSDPFVDVLSEIGKRMEIPGFYIGFVLAPVASNASEMLAAYNYATKKTQKSITTSLSTLVGAACMNNTFCLGIFLALVYFKDFAWKFQAETTSVLVIQIIVGVLAVSKSTHTTTTGIIILLCYPLCIGLVWFLENVLHWD